jgi:hypothetical protein
MRYARGATILAATLAIVGCVETRPTPPPATMCTMDAKQCPDGSYVGRSGPDCAFVCPKPADGGMSMAPGG